MARKQEPARPYFSVAHEYDAALKAYISAAAILYNSVQAAIDITAHNPESALKCIEMLKTHAEKFHKAGHGDLWGD